MWERLANFKQNILDPPSPPQPGNLNVHLGSWENNQAPGVPVTHACGKRKQAIYLAKKEE